MTEPQSNTDPSEVKGFAEAIEKINELLPEGVEPISDPGSIISRAQQCAELAQNSDSSEED